MQVLEEEPTVKPPKKSSFSIQDIKKNPALAKMIISAAKNVKAIQLKEQKMTGIVMPSSISDLHNNNNEEDKTNGDSSNIIDAST